jgi:small subunit ribosomal protein S7
MHSKKDKFMRRPVKNRNVVKSDLRYDNVKVSKFINYIMQNGKKTVAQKIVYGAFDIIKEQTKKDALELFELALKNAGPTVEVRSKRVGGSNYQIPVEVRDSRKFLLASRWLIDAARGKKGKPMHEKLAEELLLASNNEGSAVKKKEDVHKMAESNKAFAHFAR